MWGRPLVELRQEVAEHPGHTMLGAVLRLHSDSEVAEHAIDFHRDRLRRLTDPQREVDDFTARHLVDTAQRLSLAVTARAAHRAAADAVMDGLRRRDPPSSSAAPAALAAGTAQPAELLRTR